MSGTYFETFLVGGLGLLVAAALCIAWLLWRERDVRREAIHLSLEGIGHEFRFNMFQAVRELADVSNGRLRLARDLPDLEHPQLNAVLGEVMATDKRPLAALQATYQSIATAKRRLRYALDTDEGLDEALEQAKAVTINGISTLYLWEKHEGRPPERAHSTRSWWVRDWMKAHGFHQDLLPGLALRDAVVEDLRGSGMVLTPKPLTLTAHEYYSRHYDRQADPRGVFGKRRFKDQDSEGDTPADETVEDEAANADEAARDEVMPAAVAAPAAAVATADEAPKSGNSAQHADTDEESSSDRDPFGYKPFGEYETEDEDSAPAERATEDAPERGSGI